MKIRYESFGGIIALNRPPSLVFVNQAYMKKLGYPYSSLWQKSGKRLSAPTEIHFSLTNRCNQNCSHCYTDSRFNLNLPQLSYEEILSAVDMCADLGVFHMALGGGESMLLPELFSIAAYIRSKGMVPNLTTNGLIMTAELAEKCTVFGQINVSIDYLKHDSADQPRENSKFSTVLTTIRLLKKAGNHVGINLVLNRLNFPDLEEMIDFAQEEKLQDVEILRFKPAGRGRLGYFDLCCTPEQHQLFFPLILKLSRKYNINIKIDCSYVPMVCAHAPDKKLMEKFHIRGCDAGNLLAAIDWQGNVKACSFALGQAGNWQQFQEDWQHSEHYRRFIDWTNQAPEPCCSCNYLDICLGGCHVVAEYAGGSFFTPDPECPLVLAKKFPEI
jgi:radical SAM protein with 4Fe4S-binding SPASM domain